MFIRREQGDGAGGGEACGRPGQRPRQRGLGVPPGRYSRSSEEKICLVSWCLECCSIRKTDAGLSHEVSVSARAGRETLASIHGHSQTPDAPSPSPGRSVQGDSTAGSDPPAAPRVTAKPTALAQGEPGRWASGQIPAGGAGPSGRPSLPGRDPEVERQRAFLFHCLWSVTPKQGSEICKRAGKGLPVPTISDLFRRRDKGALENRSDVFSSWGRSAPFLSGDKVGDALPHTVIPPLPRSWGERLLGMGQAGGCPGVSSSTISGWV